MDNALKFDKVAPLPHDMYNRVPADLVARLEARSRERRKANPKFQKQDEMIKKFVERKARHAISLNEEKFRAEFVPDDDREEGRREGEEGEGQEEVHASIWPGSRTSTTTRSSTSSPTT